MKQISLLVVAVLLTMGMTSRLPAEEVQAARNATAVPLTYFGMHIHRIDVPQPWVPYGDKITPWPSVKFGSWRLWDAAVAWINLEPARGKWNFKTLDKSVALAEREGIDLVLAFGLTPRWASARPDEPSAYRTGSAAEPRDIEDWRTYVSTVARRYKGRIKKYELWNEVNVKGFYSGSQEKLVELARVAYQTLKEIDPGIVFVSPSVVGKDNYPWLDEYLNKGGAQYLDVVGYHFYASKASPETMLPTIRQVQGIMRKHGLGNKPLWNTETGWWIKNKKDMPPVMPVIGVRTGWRKLDDELAPAYVARSYFLSWPAGVSRLYWYAWDNTDMGFIQPDSHELKPAAVAYDTVVSWLTGGMLKQCGQEGVVWTCQLVRADGKSATAIWTENDTEQNWNIPVGWNIASVERLDGSAFKPNGRSIRIGAAPVLLIESGNTEKKP